MSTRDNIKARAFELFKKATKPFRGRGWARITPIGWLYEFVYGRLAPKEKILFNLDDLKIYLDPKDKVVSRKLLMGGSYEKFTTQIFKKEILRGNIVLDIGAHIGYYTLIAAKLVGKEGRVYAFEPDPYNFALLTQNVQINGYRNVIAIPKAATSAAGKVRLYIGDSHGIKQIFKSPKTRKGGSVEVESIALDEFFTSNEKINFIKMDIDGAEMAALQGMINTIQRSDNLRLITEFRPAFLKAAGYSPREYLYKLKELGFKLFMIDEAQECLKPANVTSIMKLYKDKESLLNLLCQKGKLN